MKVKLAKKLSQLPPYLFAELDRLKAEQVAKGADVISLGIGDPDQPTPTHIVKAGQEALSNSDYHSYPSYEGMLSFREAAASFLQTRFDISLDPKDEIVSLIGTKEGIYHLPFAFLDPGDVCLFTDPGYPVYPASTILAGGDPQPVPLKKENDFLPDFDAIPPDVAERAKIFFINFPNNPTSKIAPPSLYKDVIEFAKKYNVIIASDAAYSEFYPDDKRPPSLLQFPGGSEVGIEFHSLSKTYNMTGWRVGFAAGNPEVIAGLGKIKTNVDSGIFEALQAASIVALKGDQSCVADMRALYARRRVLLEESLQQAGLNISCSDGAFYIWVEVPDGFTSKEFAVRVLEEAAVVCTPGNGFGAAGEGYVRFSLTAPEDRLQEAAERIAKLVI
jgi:LL-diaminopimelate aminotransferase